MNRNIKDWRNTFNSYWSRRNWLPSKGTWQQSCSITSLSPRWGRSTDWEKQLWSSGFSVSGSLTCLGFSLFDKAQTHRGKEYLRVSIWLITRNFCPGNHMLGYYPSGIVSPPSLVRSRRSTVKDSVSSDTLFSFRNITFREKFLVFLLTWMQHTPAGCRLSAGFISFPWEDLLWP